MQAFAVGGTHTRPTLTETARWTLPGRRDGHDLSRRADGRYLVTTDDGVWTFDPDPGNFTPLPAPNPALRVKAVDLNGDRLAWVQAETRWWANGFTITDADGGTPHRIPGDGPASVQGTLDPVTPRHVLLAYCTAHVGKSLLWAASDLLTLYVLVTLYAVDPAVAGALFVAGLAANALADLGVGLWLDRRPRHAVPLAAGGLCVAAATLPLTMLAAPHGTAALLATTLLFRIAYAGIDVPHNALMGRLAPDAARATRLSRGRTIGTGIAAFGVAQGAQLATGPAAMTQLLWLIGGSALLISMTVIPLLRAAPLVRTRSRGPLRLGLPRRFLVVTLVGIVALGALAKAVLHLPASAHPIAGGTMLLLLTTGRTASALLPLRIRDARRGLRLLGLAFAAAALVAALFAYGVTVPLLLALGFAMGATNLIGWALLPALAHGARGYGLYAMASKLALGTAGLLLAGGLGRAPVFAAGGFAPFPIGVAAACLLAALLAAPRLTPRPRRVFPDA